MDTVNSGIEGLTKRVTFHVASHRAATAHIPTQVNNHPAGKREKDSFLFETYRRNIPKKRI